MKKAILFVFCLFLFAGSAFAQTGDSRQINSANALKAYLDSQPANSPDKPILVSMKVNDLMFDNIVKAINAAGKYVSLDLSGSPLTTIPSYTFTNFDKFYKVREEEAINDFKKEFTENKNKNEYDNYFDFIEGCKALVAITIPSSVKSIGDCAFMNCTNLINVTIPNGVISIGGGAFAMTGITSVIIPNSVKSIGKAAFISYNLISVTFQGTIPSNGFNNNEYDLPFAGDLRDKFYMTDKNNGTPGTYTTTKPITENTKWTKR